MHLDSPYARYTLTKERQQLLLEEAARVRLVRQARTRMRMPFRIRVACVLRRLADRIDLRPAGRRAYLLRALADGQITVDQALGMLEAQ